jgi:hypothetical protein
LTEKWNRTGLLRGLTGYNRENMSVMLENQAAQLLRETNTLGSGGGPGSSGDIRGFQNVAFPIVRRVFGGLVANELVSVQPMSLPSGLLFYLDYTYGTDVGGVEAGSNGLDSAVYSSGHSIYNNPAGKGIRSGSLGSGGHYDLLGSGYSRNYASQALTADATSTNAATMTATVAAAVGDNTYLHLDIAAGTGIATANESAASAAITELTGAIGRLVDFDSDLQQEINLGRAGGITFVAVELAYLTSDGTDPDSSSVSFTADRTMVKDFAFVATDSTTGINDGSGLLAVPARIQGGKNLFNVRRHNKIVKFSSAGEVQVDPLGGTHVLMACLATAASSGAVDFTTNDKATVTFPIDSRLSVGSEGDALTIPSFEADMTQGSTDGTAASPVIPEIDIKIESLAVTAVSRKLKAKWSPELAQDLNAYHSLDAEVELTQILSEQIALELDREVLNDLLTQANGASLFWSRAPGKFLNKLTGAEVARSSSLRPGPQFTGTVRDWYETLIETIIDAGNIIHRKTLRGSANFIVIGPDVATILESSVMYKPSYSIDGQGQASALSIGAEKIGNLSNRFTVYKDPYFPRNKILVGYKGGSYLETGYVYAPYVPLIVTPTIFAPEDFTPRKGVMTRYGKKMVRSDFYGTVTCLDMNII